jgi:hypothetical protein
MLLFRVMVPSCSLTCDPGRFGGGTGPALSCGIGPAASNSMKFTWPDDVTNVRCTIP